MKKILMLFVTIFLLVNAGIGVMAAEQTFSDIDGTHWAYENVRKMVQKGIINGYPDGTFRPDETISRGEFCVLLSKAAKLNIVFENNSQHWATPYINAIKENTWTYKDWYLSDDNFDAPVNRGEAAMGLCDVYLKYPISLTHKMDEVNTFLTTTYNDTTNIGAFSEVVYVMTTNNLMRGDTDGCFHAERPITRAEMCTILCRAYANEIYESTSNNVRLSAEQISEKCSPAVFYIEVYGFNGELFGSGSGFFVSSNGLAVTNYHVVANSIYREITTIDGKVYNNISIIDYDEVNDLALLKVEGSNFPYVSSGDSEYINQGQHVYAIGSPLGLSNTMSEGIISNTSRTIGATNYIQISVPINHGSSGGALIDECGNVIGVTSAGIGTNGDLNLAIPINKAKLLNANSKEDYIIWSHEYYPGFSQILDFGVFSGVKLLSSKSTPISYEEEYDIFDFHSVGSFDASDCYAYSVYYYYGEALKENGMLETVISDTELKYESELESIFIKSDFDTGKIIVSASKKPIFYNSVPALLDFGWYVYIPMEGEPSCIDDSLMYVYNWSDYYSQTDFQSMLYSYFDKLQEIGYKYLDAGEYDGSKTYLFEGYNLSIVFISTDQKLFIDIKIDNNGTDYPKTDKSQEIAYDNLKSFILSNCNDIVNGNPEFFEVYESSNGETKYSLRYNEKNGTIDLVLRRIYGGAWLYSYTELTRNNQKYKCMFNYYGPSNSTNTPDLNAFYTINAKDFRENYTISFESVTGDKSIQKSSQELAKIMNLDILEYVDFIFGKYLGGSGSSMTDFGFNLK